MKNYEIAKILYEIADILEIQNVQWKPIAYRKAARAIEGLSDDIELIYKNKGINGLKEISGVGEGIAKKIQEYLVKNKIDEFERLKKRVPLSVESLMHVPGVGPKKAFRLFNELKIKNVNELKKAAESGEIKKLKGFGEKSEREILHGLELVKKGEARKLLGKILPIARELENKLNNLPYVKKAIVGGSLRRMNETIGDIDILVVSKNPVNVINFFTSLPIVKEVIAKGKTKSVIITKENIQADVRVLEEKSFGAALQYFTGNKDHNIALRNIAIKKRMKLSEYGLFNLNTEKFIGGRDEKEVYELLGLKYIEPELRENSGEIEAAIKNKLPRLINYNEIKGDLHLHTRWSDGVNATEEMIKAAEKMKYEYIAITDHSKSQHIARGLNEEDVEKHLKEIDNLQKKFNIKILKGAEVDILSNGKLDYSDKILKKFDIVIASIHSGFKSAKEEMTKRILKALENPYVRILAHPTGRKINEREPYEVDLDKVFEKAVKNRIWIEINSFPNRLDLKDTLIRKGKEEFGAKFVISTDSHSTEHLKYIEFGIAQARRGWLEKGDIVNTLNWKEFEKLLKK